MLEGLLNLYEDRIVKSASHLHQSVTTKQTVLANLKYFVLYHAKKKKRPMVLSVGRSLYCY